MDEEDIKNIKGSIKDPSFFGEIYKKYSNRIYSYFWYRVGHDKEISEDLMQETFVKAFQHRKKFQIRKYSYFSYLLRIAHNLLVDYYRKPKAISIESVGDIPDEITLEQSYAEKESSSILWRAIQQLSNNEKDVLLLFYQDKLKIKEIAKITNKSENAVKLILSRTRKKLQNHPDLRKIAKYLVPERKQNRGKYLNKE